MINPEKHQNASKPNEDPPKINPQENSEDFDFCLLSITPGGWLSALPGINSFIPQHFLKTLSIPYAVFCAWVSVNSSLKDKGSRKTSSVA